MELLLRTPLLEISDFIGILKEGEGGTSLPILHWTWETPCIELGIARADPAQIFGYICYQFNELERNL